MMTATECPTIDQLKALTLGQLSDGDSHDLFEHISGCDACRTELETVEDSGDSLVSSLRAPDEYAGFNAEPECREAVVKALGALALSERDDYTSDIEHNFVIQNLPQSIGEYDLVRLIGRGGMGNVFLARHTKLGREVALKVLSSHRLTDVRMRERFDAEMRAVGRLSHPNIVTAHDAREVDGMAVLVTEYVFGLDLEQLLQRTGPLNVADACEIARQIAVALTYTHAQGFVHRDIKPSNVMLSAEGEVKLLDLGLARFQHSEDDRVEVTGTGQAMGTADYVAPEQVTDSKTVDIRADIYALGCTLTKLLTGRAPFADDQHLTAFAKMTAHVTKTPPSLAESLPGAPRVLVRLVDSMLSKFPADRPASPKQIVDGLSPHCTDFDLKRLCADALILEPRKQTASGTSTAAKPATQPWLKRSVSRWAAIAAGFFGVLLGACLAIFIVITNPDGTRTILQLAEGSKVEIREGSLQESTIGGAANAPAMTQVEPPATPENDESPLSFGILVNRDSTHRMPSATESQILEATRLLRSGDGSKPVRTQFGTWYAIADDQIGAPIKEKNAGKEFVLVSNDDSIRWPRVKGHVLTLQINAGRGSSIDLHLDKGLGREFAELTGRNIRNQLAIIVDGQVRSAPIVNDKIGEAVSITGRFSLREAQQLSQWLHGGLVDTPPKPDDQSESLEGQSRSADQQGNSADKHHEVSSEPALVVYQLPADTDLQLAYRVVSTLLAEQSNARLEFDESAKRLVLLATPSQHALVRKTLDALGVDDSTGQFDGVWRILSVQDRGRDGFMEPNAQAACVIQDGKIAIFRSDLAKSPDEGGFEIEQGTLTVERGTSNVLIHVLGQPPVPGIIRLSRRNQLELCVNTKGDERPKEFESKSDSPNILLFQMQRIALPENEGERAAFLADPANATVALAFDKLNTW